MYLEQVDAEGHPFSYLKGVEFRGPLTKSCDPSQEKLEFLTSKQWTGNLTIRLDFQGHYEEPLLALPVKLSGKGLG